MELKGSIAVITGGGSGLGAETARQMAAAGIKVAILDQNMQAAQTLADELGGMAVPTDVVDSASVENAFTKVVDTLGIPRICVNCAGIIAGARVVGREGPLKLDSFRRVIEVNLIGTFNVLRMAAFHMMSLVSKKGTEERGVIINTASVAAFEGQLGQAAYSASKGGVVSMTLPIARELASYGIRVMCIAPGIFDTGMMASLSDGVKQSLLSSTVFPKRLGKPEEFADMVLQIVKNPMLNGSVIRLDGAIRLAVH